MTVMKWNLVDHLSSPTGHRVFFPPVAAWGPGMSSTVYPPATSWNLARVQIDRADGTRTDDIVLEVEAIPPTGGFVDEGSLPDPRIRLHAMGSGFLRFKPASGGQGPSLELQLSVFLAAISHDYAPLWHFPAWWQRWMQAGCIPASVIYENVDPVHLKAMLGTVAAPPDTSFENRVPPTLGLSFPQGVRAATAAQFITEFMAGDPDRFMVAEPGAYIGRITAGQGSSATMLRLHARYQGHTSTIPNPMSPLELLYLLFGENSAEATNHPFLKQITNTASFQQNPNESPSHWMMMRPPLRTSDRVRWEVNWENAHDQHGPNHIPQGKSWGYAGSLGPSRFFNSSKKFGRHFNNGSYNDKWKCNLFVFDFVMRAGFRVPVHAIGSSSVYHYNSPNMVANYVHRVSGSESKIPLLGMELNDWPQNTADKSQIWGWKIENSISSNPVSTMKTSIAAEGRCIILSLAAPRALIEHEELMSVSYCLSHMPAEASGHVLIVSELHNATFDAQHAGTGPIYVKATCYAAGEVGIYHESRAYARRAGPHGDGYPRLHLVELHPGMDPDTIQGQADLNVACWEHPSPKTSEFSAKDTLIAIDQFGNTISYPTDQNGKIIPSSAKYCRDNVTSTTPTTPSSLWPP